MQVVLVLPPRDTETLVSARSEESQRGNGINISTEPHLAQVPEKQATRVVERAVFEHLVVQEIVREPAALLPEQRLKGSAVSAACPMRRWRTGSPSETKQR